jgi:hypothetical protein
MKQQQLGLTNYATGIIVDDEEGVCMCLCVCAGVGGGEGELYAVLLSLILNQI